MESEMKHSGFGIASLILGIIGILTSCIMFGIVPSVIGLALGIVGMIVKNRKRGLSIAGISCSVAGIVLFILSTTLFGSLISAFNDEKEPIASTVEQNRSTENREYDTETEETPISNEFYVGDVLETDELRISYLSAEEYTSGIGFMQPKDGNVYYRMEFEFENISDSDQFVSSYNFECYADGYSVDRSFAGDDDLNSTISPGKKAKGGVYFEVPSDAESIVLEYETNVWTEDKIEFVVK